MPAFPRSTRDGFACRAAEAASHEHLTVAGMSRAGDAPAAPLLPGSAWEIMTGAAVPAGADAVAMLEHVEQVGSRVQLAPGRTIEPGENIVPAGAEARGGDELVRVGTRLHAPQIAAAATCGYARLEVFARPRVAILTTGDELVPVGSAPLQGQIRNSNAAMLAVLVAGAGGEPWILPPVKDDEQALDAALRAVLEADLVLISGGVSAGKFDLVEPALSRMGARFHFTGVRIQPGKPLVFGEIPCLGVDAGSVAFFGLPGNPISSAATFSLFGVPFLAALAGSSEPQPQCSVARLTRAVQGKPGLTRFVPASREFHALGGDLPAVAPVNWQGSGDLAAFARANCFLVVPEGVDRLEAGSVANLLPL
jgi:molybdopterin molybdotransferase